VSRLADFLGTLYKHREMIWAMSKRDLEARYIGTIGGPLWAIFHPIVTVLIYWFVFSVGFKAVGPSGMPFVLYLLGGLIPWLLFNNTLLASVSAVTGNSHLVKKTTFPTEVLPIVNWLSETFTHVVLFLILCIVTWSHGHRPTLYLLQLPYYYVALGVFVLGLSWLVSSIQVFHRDLSQGLLVILNLWFWITPIIWMKDMLPTRYNWITDYNPAYYIVQGYRNSLLIGEPFWNDWSAALRFWMIAMSFLLLGVYVFRRLKAEFADVL